MSDFHRLETTAIRRAFERAATAYDGAAILQREVRDRLISRLDIVRSEPQVVVDLGAGTGHASRLLKARFPRAVVVAIDSSRAMLREARRQQRLFKRFERVCADAFQLPLRARSVDWCISNLMLPWCDSVDELFAEVARVLQPGGLFSFTTYGPDTLHELRTAWTTVDDGPHVHRFLDMHDLGDALMRAGLAEPVVDAERIVLTYGDLEQLMRELKATGSTTATIGRQRGLSGRRLLRALVNAYEPLKIDARLPLTFEIVYGQAWLPTTPRASRDRTETRIGIDKIGHR